MILDYSDLVKVGGITEDSSVINIPDGERKYAVIIKTAGKEINAFDITDKESVEKEIKALRLNDKIPEEIRKSAEYYIKLAADHFGIEFDSTQGPAPRIIHYHTSPENVKTATIPVLNIGGKKFILDDYEAIKEAEECFLNRRNSFSPTDRIEISKIIEKVAEDLDYNPGVVVRAYSSAKYGDNVKHLLDIRKTANEQVTEVVNKLKSNYNTIPISEFLEMVQDIDKIAGVNPIKRNVDYYRFLATEMETETIKVATETNISSNEIINSIV